MCVCVCCVCAGKCRTQTQRGFLPAAGDEPAVGEWVGVCCEKLWYAVWMGAAPLTWVAAIESTKRNPAGVFVPVCVCVCMCVWYVCVVGGIVGGARGTFLSQLRVLPSETVAAVRKGVIRHGRNRSCDASRSVLTRGKGIHHTCTHTPLPVAKLQ